MESEKVKEIKKVLEMFAIDGKEMTLFQSPVLQGESCVKTIKYADILTLINELESENERLLEQRNKTYNIWVKDTEKLKDRIAELEKENKELLKENEGWHGSYRCAIDKIGELSAERYIKVERFAKKLKKKLFDLGNIVTENDIDETLKEMLEQ